MIIRVIRGTGPCYACYAKGRQPYHRLREATQRVASLRSPSPEGEAPTTAYAQDDSFALRMTVGVRMAKM